MSTARHLALSLLLLGGCAETCPLPQAELNQKVWTVDGRVTSLAQEPAPEWPSESLPFNGRRDWTISWTTTAYESPVVVTIDDQVFEGNGVFDDVECGNFSVAFQGSFFGEDGAEHLLGAGARLIVWPDGIDGFIDFESAWQAVDGVQGTASGTAQLSTTTDAEIADTGAS